MNTKAILIFQKNRELGKVKTRLAATIGDENALLIYNKLVDKAHENVASLDADKFIFFSDRLENDARWNGYQQRVQFNGDLGERMHFALKEILELGYEQAVLIGTDCYELDSSILVDAFSALETHDYVLGPANDGGYYLIGGVRTDETVFLNKEWSTERVAVEALESIEAIGCSVYCINHLNDVDVEADLGELKSFLA